MKDTYIYTEKNHSFKSKNTRRINFYSHLKCFYFYLKNNSSIKKTRRKRFIFKMSFQAIILSNLRSNSSLKIDTVYTQCIYDTTQSL